MTIFFENQLHAIRITSLERFLFCTKVRPRSPTWFDAHHGWSCRQTWEWAGWETHWTYLPMSTFSKRQLERAEFFENGTWGVEDSVWKASTGVPNIWVLVWGAGE